jgi:single-strand DNA-binding protein
MEPRAGFSAFKEQCMYKGNVNKVILVGRLGQTPILRHTEKGTAVLNLSVATNRDIKNAQGEEAQETTWHRASVWGAQAEACAKYLTQGSRIYLEGELRQKTWEDREGQERKTMEVYTEKVTFLGGGQRSGSSETAGELAEAVALA